MRTHELEDFARDKSRGVLEALAKAVGPDLAAEIMIRVALESLLNVDIRTAAHIFRCWAADCETDLQVN